MRDLSIIIGVKNRSRATCSRRPLALFPRCLDAICKAHEQVGTLNLEVVVVDWSSTDWPLQEWIGAYHNFFPLKVVTIQEEGFSIGKSRNVGAAAAGSDLLFFLDCDMLLGAEGLKTCYDLAKQGKAVFPVVSYCMDQDQQRMYRQPAATGNGLVNRHLWEQAGKWREWYFWGPEDWRFQEACAALSEIARPETPDIIHQWHPDAWRGEVRKAKAWHPGEGEPSGVAT